MCVLHGQHPHRAARAVCVDCTAMLHECAGCAIVDAGCMATGQHHGRMRTDGRAGTVCISILYVRDVEYLIQVLSWMISFLICSEGQIVQCRESNLIGSSGESLLVIEVLKNLIFEYHIPQLNLKIR